MCPPLLIPLAIGFGAGLLGGQFGDFLANIFFPMEMPPEREFDAEWINALEEAQRQNVNHVVPKGYFSAGLTLVSDSFLSGIRSLCRLQ
jgi:hypothetical protein